MSCLFVRVAATTLAALAIAACGPAAPAANISPTAAAPTTAAPTVVPVTDVPAVVTPELPTAMLAEPTAVPAVPTALPSGVLPAPLYLTDKGQIVRIETDGTTNTPITNEPSEGDALAITEFAISPADGSLAYVVLQGGEHVLVRADADGKNRTELFQESGASIHSPVWSPSGEQLAVSIVRSSPDGTRGESGVYLLSSQGGTPLLVQPDDPMADLGSGEMSFAHMLQSWSPDGSSFLLSRYGMATEYCELAIRLFDQDKLTKPAPPSENVRDSCGPTAWSADSRSIYMTFVPTDNMYVQGAGLWRVDTASGQASRVVPTELDGKVPVVNNPVETTPGQISAFVAMHEKLPAMFDEQSQQPAYRLSRINVATGEISPLRDDTYSNIGRVLWAEGGSGAVVQIPTEQGYFGLTWLPADGGASVQLSTSPDVYGFAWGK